MPKHKPRENSCSEADRLADEQIATLEAEVARLNAELWAWRTHVCTPATPHQWWQPAPSYPIITCSTTTTGQTAVVNRG